VALTKRCANCGASNTETAEWCSQCLERFDSAVPEPAVVGGPPAPPGEAAPAGAEKKRSSPPVDTGAFQVTEEGINWVCRTCGSANSIDVFTCSVCGTTFAEHVRPESERPQRDPATTAMISLFFPGAGHAYLGMWGQAVARGVLSLWVLLVAVVGLVDKDVPGSLVMASFFGFVALLLWIVAAHDAFREATNDTGRVLLRGRRFLYLVLALMALLFVAMLVALMTARSRAPEGALSIPPWPSTSYPISTGQPTG
jgi:ribosomal protein L40E